MLFVLQAQIFNQSRAEFPGHNAHGRPICHGCYRRTTIGCAPSKPRIFTFVPPYFSFHAAVLTTLSLNCRALTSLHAYPKSKPRFQPLHTRNRSLARILLLLRGKRSAHNNRNSNTHTATTREYIAQSSSSPPTALRTVLQRSLTALCSGLRSYLPGSRSATTGPEFHLHELH